MQDLPSERSGDARTLIARTILSHAIDTHRHKMTVRLGGTRFKLMRRVAKIALLDWENKVNWKDENWYMTIQLFMTMYWQTQVSGQQIDRP